MKTSDSMGQIHGGGLDGDAENNGGGGEGDIVVNGELCLHILPEDCISNIISFTSPREACVAALVSKTFKSAAHSDIIWERFLPQDYAPLVPESLVFQSKKELYLSLSDNPVLIDDGKKSLWLEKRSGKKCFMISSMDLTIVWGDTPTYWQWISVPESRFERVAELHSVCWLEIHGKIGTRMLSPGARYSAYIVFKATERCSGFSKVPVEAGVGVVGSEASHRLICFDAGRGEDSRGGSFVRMGGRRGDFRVMRPWLRPHVPDHEEEEMRNNLVEPKERGDGWMEVELGEFFNNGVGNYGDEIEISVLETKRGHWKSGLVIQGIEIRPKEDDGNK